MALPDLNALIAKWGPEEGNRRWMVQMSNQGYSFAPSVSDIRELSGLPQASAVRPIMLAFPSLFPGASNATAPSTPVSPMTSIGSPSAPIPAAAAPIADAAAQVAGASKPVVPQFVTPYVKPTGPGAFGESDVNPFYTNKKMF